MSRNAFSRVASGNICVLDTNKYFTRLAVTVLMISLTNDVYRCRSIQVM